MTCPVCCYNDIAETSTLCPNCQTNLAPFKMVTTLAKSHADLRQVKSTLQLDLQEQMAAYDTKLQKKNNTIGWMVIGFLFVATFATVLGYRNFKAKNTLIQRQKNSLQFYENNVVDYKKQIEELSTKLHVLEQTQNIRELKYKVKPGDVLHELGELFYNDSDAGIQIALDNKIYDIRGLPVGETLTIKYRD